MVSSWVHRWSAILSPMAHPGHRPPGDVLWPSPGPAGLTETLQLPFQVKKKAMLWKAWSGGAWSGSDQQPGHGWHFPTPVMKELLPNMWLTGDIGQNLSELAHGFRGTATYPCPKIPTLGTCWSLDFGVANRTITTLYHFMGNRWGNSGNSVRLYFFWAPKSLQMVTAAMKLKDAYSLEEKLWAT